MNDYKVDLDDYLMWLCRVAERMGLNVLQGITYGYKYEMERDEFQIIVSYYYYGGQPAVKYRETLPNYLRNMDEAYVTRNVEIAYRGLIKRSFSTEINRIFGGDFNPL